MSAAPLFHFQSDARIFLKIASSLICNTNLNIHKHHIHDKISYIGVKWLCSRCMSRGLWFSQLILGSIRDKGDRRGLCTLSFYIDWFYYWRSCPFWHAFKSVIRSHVFILLIRYIHGSRKEQSAISSLKRWFVGWVRSCIFQKKNHSLLKAYFAIIISLSWNTGSSTVFSTCAEIAPVSLPQAAPDPLQRELSTSPAGELEQTPRIRYNYQQQHPEQNRAASSLHGSNRSCTHGLYIPLLPYKTAKGRLVFTLCRTCRTCAGCVRAWCGC